MRKVTGSAGPALVLRFGFRRAQPRRRGGLALYQTFIADGIDHGDRPDLVGRAAGQEGAVGLIDLRVLGDLDCMRPDPSTLTIAH